MIESIIESSPKQVISSKPQTSNLNQTTNSFIKSGIKYKKHVINITTKTAETNITNYSN